jgi:hypothetical protein
MELIAPIFGTMRLPYDKSLCGKRFVLSRFWFEHVKTGCHRAFVFAISVRDTHRRQMKIHE